MAFHCSPTSLATLMAVFLFAGCKGGGGGSDPNIFGGAPVEADDAVARAAVSLSNEKGEPLCTGVLVSKVQVLTAAHCVSGNAKIYASFGVIVMKGEGSIKNATLVKKAKVHADYRGVPSGTQVYTPYERHDIALLTLSSPAPEGSIPAKILPGYGAMPINVSIAGYGKTGTPEIDASNKLRLMFIKGLSVIDSNFNTEFMARRVEQGTMSGDSGAPVYAIMGKEVRLAGIVSRSSTKGEDPWTISTTLKPYWTWLASEGAISIEESRKLGNFPPMKERPGLSATLAAEEKKRVQIIRDNKRFVMPGKDGADVGRGISYVAVSAGINRETSADAGDIPPELAEPPFAMGIFSAPSASGAVAKCVVTAIQYIDTNGKLVSDRALTAGHCIPNGVCDGVSIKWEFPNLAADSTCLAVEAFSNNGDADFAVLKIGSAPPNQAKLESNVSVKGSLLRIVWRDPIMNGWAVESDYGVNLSSSGCAIHGSVSSANTSFYHQCPTEGVASGAALIDVKNRIVGVHNTSAAGKNTGTYIETVLEALGARKQ